MHYSKWLLAPVIAITLAGEVSCGEGFDRAVAGTWCAEMGEAKESRKRGLLWHIAPTGKSSMSLLTTEKGSLTTNPERFGVTHPDSPSEVSHGLYKLAGADSFSIQTADSAGEWIQWTRVPPGGKPKAPADCLPATLLAETKGGAPGTAFNAGLVGLWQATVPKKDAATEMVWRIRPDGQSVCVTVAPLATPDVPATVEAGRGVFKMTLSNGVKQEGTYRFPARDILEVTIGKDVLSWTRLGAQSAGR